MSATVCLVLGFPKQYSTRAAQNFRLNKALVSVSGINLHINRLTEKTTEFLLQTSLNGKYLMFHTRDREWGSSYTIRGVVMN